MCDRLAQHAPLRVGLIGFGAIGAEVYERTRDRSDIHIAQVLVRPGKVADVQARTSKDTEVIAQAEDLVRDLDVVLEVAGHDALATHGIEVLERGIELCIVSVGALADDTLRRRLTETAVKNNARAQILSGAIGGIDALAAAGAEGLTEVVYTGRKPPSAWAGSPAEDMHDLATLSEETVVFEGTARETALRFPKNANVVATVALAGRGLDETRARLIADPKASGNSHHVLARGPVVELDFTTRGKALPSNPRTSALTLLSALRCLKNRAGPIVL